MQADAAQSSTWRNYCVQFPVRTYKATPAPALRAAVRERFYLLTEAPDPRLKSAARAALKRLGIQVSTRH